MPADLSPQERAFVAAARVGRVATASSEGIPHVAPVCPVLDGGAVIFATDTDSRKHRNLLANPSVAMTLDEYSDDWDRLRYVIVFGRARLFDDGDAWRHGRDLLNEKFPQYPTAAPIELGGSVMVEIPIDRVARMGFG